MPDQADYNCKLIAEFRAAQGGGSFAGRPLLLLTTTGARSGRPHTTPMMYIRAEDRLFVVASNAGAPAHPDWYHNVVAHPAVTAELGPERFAATAAVLEDAERERLWPQIVAQAPFFVDHQAKVTRQIPVVAL